MKARYLNYVNFVAVLTPHFIEQWYDREHLVPAGWDVEDYIQDIWDIADVDVTFGVQFANAFVYGKKKYNHSRNRWELELISLTPANHFHTQDKKFAQLIKIAGENI